MSDFSRPTVSAAAVDDRGSYVDWGAVFAGIILASAISVVLLEFGSAIGLSFASFSTKGYAIAAGIGAALWFLWVQVSSFMAGAYLTGRLRKPMLESTEHETEVRDGSHGLVMWAGCTLIGAVLALGGASWLAGSVGSVVKTATETAGVAAPAAMQYYSDTLLRAAPQAAGDRGDRNALSSEINTILARSALAAPTDDDKAYLAQVVAQQTGVNPDDAKARVDKTYAAIESAKSDAAKAAETARKVSIIAAFLLAASMLVSAAAAYWAACSGGRHRKEAAVFEGFFRRVP